LSQLIVPVPIAPNPDDINAGAEIAGMLPKEDLLRLLNQFQQSEEIKLLAAENGLDGLFFYIVCHSFYFESLIYEVRGNTFGWAGAIFC